MNKMFKVQVGQQHYYLPYKENMAVSENDTVIFQLPTTLEYGEVVSVFSIKQPFYNDSEAPTLLRKATPEDIQKYVDNQMQKEKYQHLFKKEVKKCGLEMHLIDVHISFNRDKVTFYYTANERVDFRQLVKNLASIIKARIELRQLNERERAKYVGGIGPCGYELCCSRFLPDFQTVNVKMAKTQQLSFNLQRVTGLCDRLLCCLKYEQEQYVEMKKEVPDLYKKITLDDGRKAKVVGLQLISREITLQYEEGTVEKLSFEAFLPMYVEKKKVERIQNDE